MWVSVHIIEWQAGGRNLYIRELVSMEDYREVEKIQIEAWGFDELDVVPSGQLIAAKWAGAVLLGAFDDQKMIGFVYGFPALEGRHVSLHSHMLAVRPENRSLHAGIHLKLAQRIKALEQGLDEISWTFDPLQVLNANLNFARLGVISHRYIVNFYGEETSSPLHRGVGTDRLWVRWLISTERVRRRIASAAPNEGVRQAAHAEPLAAVLALAETQLGDPGPDIFVRDRGPWRRLAEPSTTLASQECLIEIPPDIGALKRSNIELAQRWRSIVQATFLESFASGFIADEFIKLGSPSEPRWFYLLVRKEKLKVAG
jgi:predicted GNAT superfamily acetyltransferase